MLHGKVIVCLLKEKKNPVIYSMQRHLGLKQSKYLTDIFKLYNETTK